DGGDWVKAAVYVYRANHGQFNTVWGDNDVGDSGWLLRKHLLLTGDEQRQAGKVFITGFLEATLHGRREYLPMFADHRTAGGWLPRTIYISRFDRPTTRLLADFEEGIDVTRGSADGVRLEGRRLATWKEVGLTMRSRGLQPFNNNAVMLGWTAPDSVRKGAVPSYTLALPDTLATSWKLARASSLVFSLANYGGPRPRPLARGDTAAPLDSAAAARVGGDSAVSAHAGTANAATRDDAHAKASADSVPLDFDIELVMADGRTVSVPLSAVAPVRPPLTVQLWKWTFVEKRFGAPAKDHDDVLASYRVPLALFAERLDGFDPHGVRAVRFVFDRGPAGTILLDDVGFDV
ncbi:MAG: hypothetical protein HYR75_09350, partial [Gemmatimonadetes bacterium]|nr:hypothetical protein [Gemmatimonadota bacterium]